MNCKLARQRITDDLSHRFDEEIKAHLKSCPECRHLCNDLVALEKLAHSLRDQYQVPEGFDAKVLHHAPTYGFFGWRPIFVALVIVMLSFGFFWMNDAAADRDDLLLKEEFAVGKLPDELKAEDPAYIEVVIQDPEEGEMMLHLPSVIEIRRTELHEDFHYQDTGF